MLLVTGGAGFIGSNLVKHLVSKGEVEVIDDLSSGKISFIKKFIYEKKIRFFKKDIKDKKIFRFFKNVEVVWHLASNSDTRTALKDTKKDVFVNIIGTYNVLEAMRKYDIEKIVFTSSSTVYGLAKKIPTPEDYPLKPISLYGSSKLAAEALIRAYSSMYGIKAVIFRLANIVGPNLTHGIIYDLIKKLRKNPKKLEILGDGSQRKSYLWVEDCILGMITLAEKVRKDIEIFNLGSEDWISVKEIVKMVCDTLEVRPKILYGMERSGWKGDVPLMRLDISKARKYGWKPKYSSKEAVSLSIKWMVEYLNKNKKISQ